MLAEIHKPQTITVVDSHTERSRDTFTYLKGLFNGNENAVKFLKIYCRLRKVQLR